MRNVKVAALVYEAKPLIVACAHAHNEEDTIAKVVLLAQKCLDKVLFAMLVLWI